MREQYNQIANLVLTQQEINIAIGDKAPSKYFGELSLQCTGGPKLYGNITNLESLRENLKAHAVPLELLDTEIPFNDFLELRRIAMSQKIRSYYMSLALP